MTWTTPATAAAGELSSAFWNEQVRENLATIGNAAPSFTATTTNITLGTGGTVTGWARVMGKNIKGHVEVTLGTGGALTGTPTITVPAAMLIATNGMPVTGVALLFDASGPSRRYFQPIRAGASTLGVADPVAGVASVTATSPWTWASGDQLIFDFDYEAA